MSGDHVVHEDTAAYLLGALTEPEVEVFERHVADCPRCREEVERLRPAVDALPRSVPQIAPPPTLKRSLMEVVERTARARDEERPARALGGLGRWVRRRQGARTRPAAAWIAASLALGLALLGAGFGVARLLSDDTRTLAAAVDERRAPRGSATLVIPEDGGDGAILRMRGMPALERGRAYQLWIQRDGEIVPQSTFNVGEDGSGAGAVTEGLEGVDAVMVTRERRRGARAPTEPPLVRVDL